jgi:DNA glycosylase AlkZ-like
VTPGRLSPRALNRAALHRQLLLDRAPVTALDAVGQLAGLQAQAPLAPYVGLWTRLAGFRHEELKELITERAVLRAHLMRNTVHLVDTADYVRFRPLYQPLLARHLAGNFGKNLIGVDLAELAAAAADLLGQTALTRVELGARLAPRWPDHDPASLAYAASHLLPLVQVPPRGLWGEPNHRAAFFPDQDVPAPPRFLPEYDNLLLSYAERSRVIPHRRPVPLPPGHGGCGGTLLVGGLWQADWKISQGVLEIQPFISLNPADRDAVAAEGERLLGFAAPAIAVRDVRFVPVRSG